MEHIKLLQENIQLMVKQMVDDSERMALNLEKERKMRIANEKEAAHQAILKAKKSFEEIGKCLTCLHYNVGRRYICRDGADAHITPPNSQYHYFNC